MPRSGIQFAHLEGLDGSRFSLGWRPRDARRRLAAPVDWSGDPWLQVHGEVASPESSWSFVDPALTEHEARDLAEFLDLRPWTGPRVFECTEPGLAFKAVGEASGIFTMAIRFSLECAPPQARSPGAQAGEAFTLMLDVTDAALRRFVRSMLGMLGVERRDPGSSTAPRGKHR
ncbi:MAG: hypothetical protein DYG92_03705 [Leptolyngbya sp. PLA1]|nr:hypothetical protein [Leptolyngbya sp. PLA1]